MLLRGWIVPVGGSTPDRHQADRQSSTPDRHQAERLRSAQSWAENRRNYVII